MSIKVRNQITGQWEEISNTKGDNYVLTQADKQEIATLVPRDSTMSDTSENAVQNKVVKKYVDDLTDENNWELIEEIVVGENDHISEIIRNVDTNKIPYDFIEAEIIAHFLGKESSTFYQNDVLGIAGGNSILCPGGRKENNSEQWMLCRFNAHNNGLRAEYTDKGQWGEPLKVYVKKGVQIVSSPINEIRIKTSVGEIPAGSTFTIKAIRAKE